MTPLSEQTELPHTLIIHIPFPSHRLAQAALRSIAVDEELSSLVKRDFALVSTVSEDRAISGLKEDFSKLDIKTEENSVLRVHYRATTPRMLRVAVNGFFDSLRLVVQVMEELDVDVLHEKGFDDLAGVQGVIEQGMTGTAGGS